MDIIPAIDIIEGKCVRLQKGDYSSKKEYSSDPLEVARKFESWGIKRLHLVDLDGARAKKIVNHKILARIAAGTGLIIDFGGGLRTDSDIRIAFENGASMITGGSVAINDPGLFLEWLSKFGPEKIILGADHKNEKIAVNGWYENSDAELFRFLLKYIKQGITQVICTDINKDGMLEGPSFDLYKRILDKWPELYLVASGGVSSPTDLKELEKTGLPAVIIGKAIYENRITEKDLQPFLE
jgi:phosphoribosylformimino-5-aminoimidazole carboxamide ribotide isomerase